MYLVIGGSGFLGSYVLKEIAIHSNEPIIATSTTERVEPFFNDKIKWVKCNILNRLDIERLYEICKQNSLKVFFLAACHHPDEVKRDVRKAWKVNITGLSYFLESFDNIEKLIYPSTEVVYGDKQNYKFKENSKLSPVSEYGRMKPIAEHMVNYFDFNVVRLPVMIGPSLIKGKEHFYDIIVNRVKKREKIGMFYDQYRTFLDFLSVSEILYKLINIDEINKYPIINIAGDECISKFELGKRICYANGLDDSLIYPISIYENNGIFTEKRASSTCMDNSLVKKLLNIKSIQIKL